MSKITITVPDGDTCRGCEYLSSSYRENRMRCGETSYNCLIFKTEILSLKKCIGCKICAVEEQ